MSEEIDAIKAYCDGLVEINSTMQQEISAATKALDIEGISQAIERAKKRKGELENAHKDLFK